MQTMGADMCQIKNTWKQNYIFNIGATCTLMENVISMPI